jgi:hypothetical protein
MSLTTAERNAMTDAEIARLVYASVHTTDPGSTGAAEATGGTPAYARKLLVWNASGAQGPLGATLQPATIGTAWSTELTFDLAGATYAYYGAWSAVTAGTFRGGNQLLVSGSPVPQVLSSQGQLKTSFAFATAAS